MNKHPEEVKTSVVNRYLNGESTSKISKSLNVSRTTVYAWIQQRNNSFNKGKAPNLVLSSIFRKFVSDKMKLRTGIPVMERLRSACLSESICRRRCQGRRSRSSRPLTPSAAHAIRLPFMPPLLRLRSNISCKDTALNPTPFLTHTAVWRRPTSEQTFHPGMCRRLSSCAVSHGLCVR